MMKGATIIITFALLITLAGTAAAGPVSLLIGVQDRRLHVVGVDELGPADNDQTSVRSTFTWRAGEKWTLVGASAWASSYLSVNDTRLSGATDGRFRLLYRPTPDWVIGGGTIFPFGLYELSANEVTAGQWMWNPRSGFPISSFGEGLGWEGTIARAFSLSGNITGGFGAAYVRHAKFDLLDQGGEYRLGDEGGISLALDFDLGTDRKLRLDGAYVFFGTDRLNGEDHIDQGNQVTGLFSLDWPLGSFGSWWAARYTIKSDNTLYDDGDPESSLEISQPSGSYLFVDGRISHAAGQKALIFAQGRYSNMAGSDYPIGANGNSLAFGPGIGWKMSRSVSWSVQYSRIDGEGDGGVTFDGNDILFTLEMRSH